MKIKTIKQKHGVGVWLTLSQPQGHRRALVEMRPDDGVSDGELWTAIEARRLARALDAFAGGADKENAKNRRRKERS